MQQEMDKMNNKLLLITPEWAAERLEELRAAIEKGLFRQRNPREKAIQKYAADMKAGKWQVTHQGIAFDSNGFLIDGQNRLWAVVRSHTAVWMWVNYYPPGSENVRPMDVIDVGATRTIADALRITHGYVRGAAESAAVARQWLNMIVRAKGPKTGEFRRANYAIAVSTDEAAFALEDLGLQRSIERFGTIVDLRRLRKAPITAVWCYYHMAKPKLAEDLAHEYATLEELKRGSPVIAMQRYFEIRVQKRTNIEEQQQTVANVIQAWADKEPMLQAAPSREALEWLFGLNPSLVDKVLKRVI